MIKVILFDFDGTIADSFNNSLKIINKLSDKHNLSAIKSEDVKELRSEDARTLIKMLKIPFYRFPFIVHDFKKMQKQEINQIKIFKDLPEVFFKLKDMGFKLGILSSNSLDIMRIFIKNNNIDIFDYIYADAGIFGKDKAINKFLKQNSLTKEQILYIGDEIRDIHACQKVGVKIISVTWGFNSKEGLRDNKPDFLVDTPMQLLKILEEKNRYTGLK